jgi:hypothetical protein
MWFVILTDFDLIHRLRQSRLFVTKSRGRICMVDDSKVWLFFIGNVPSNTRTPYRYRSGCTGKESEYFLDRDWNTYGTGDEVCQENVACLETCLHLVCAHSRRFLGRNLDKK